ncbi:hypothetical protein FA95DRAFT_1585536 [Auriscalpium vulgare]|uniref:Uncharacterized protein n=1 Tax=Auriscalpium vulgare TaxID=40419 RepID=A0ACB8R300_9AGAM|nr:hypothetical protein FA95DRAFT_1585536 [Auriscalpium vulgare]
MNWMWTGSAAKSVAELNRLVHDVILAPDFEKDHLQGFDAKRETDILDKSLQDSGNDGVPTMPGDGWRESSVDIRIPDGQRHSSPADRPIPIFTVPGLHHRSLVETIKAAWTDARSTDFHYTPFRHFWKRGTDTDAERIRDEIYSSDAFIKADEEIRSLPAEPGCTLERTVCAMMLWSDSTHLASFGTAALWPMYLFFGNQSKYTRAQPRSGACHHVAYIPKVRGACHDTLISSSHIAAAAGLSLTGLPPPDDIITHCRRELMHAVLKLMLDDAFLEAYQHGIVIKCPDGVTRRIYPRLFTYSADYPEKVLLAAIRNLGTCPCPRCKMGKADIPNLGMLRDDAYRVKHPRTDDEGLRQKITAASDAVYRLGKGVKSAPVERLLAEESYVPTTNAFSERLSPFGFDLFPMLVVDLMHEFELGVWKAVFTHLIRILVAVGGDTVQKLNERFPHSVALRFAVFQTMRQQ